MYRGYLGEKKYENKRELKKELMNRLKTQCKEIKPIKIDQDGWLVLKGKTLTNREIEFFFAGIWTYVILKTSLPLTTNNK